MCVFFLSFSTFPAQTDGPMTLNFCMGIGYLGLRGQFLVNQGQRSRSEKCLFEPFLATGGQLGSDWGSCLHAGMQR